MKSEKTVIQASKKLRASYKKISNSKSSQYDLAYALGVAHAIEWVLDEEDLNTLVNLVMQKTA